jgi:hypothetical protein
MHSIDMPLVAINSFISIEYDHFKLPNFIFNRPYSDHANADIKGNLTNVTILHKQYYRPRSNFNPTLKTNAQARPSAYDYYTAVEKGILGASVLNSNKRKFVIYNSDITVENIRFYEATYDDATENALFFPYFSPYKWVTANNCIFELRQ